jgi:hypothetical protein
MGGYRLINNTLSGPIRGTHVSSADGFSNIHTGWSGGIQRVQVGSDGTGAGLVDRSPVGFTADNDYLWQFDSIWDAAGNNTLLIAHPGLNLTNIDNVTTSPVYAGDISDTSALTSIGESVAGGVVAMPPFLMLYDAYGYVKWSDENLPFTYTGGASGSARITSSKIVQGLRVRGGGQSPSAVLWSQTSVIRATYIGGAAIFRFDTVTDQSSVLSSQAVVEYDGLFFWPGVDRFLVYNGVVQEVSNPLNTNWFFDNLNWDHRQKVWGTKVPRYGEIWWFYPRGSNTECSHAIVYNIREQTWYDTELARTSGHFAQTFRYPVFAQAGTVGQEDHSLWTHETGWDRVEGNNVYAIPAWFETSDITLANGGPDQQWLGLDRWTHLSRFEPDFLQTGDLTLSVTGKKYPKDTDYQTTNFTFSEDTEKIDLREQRRLMRLKVTSNTQGGFFEMGQPLLHIEDNGDGRQ